MLAQKLGNTSSCISQENLNPHAAVSAGANVPYRTGRKLAHLSAFSMTPMGHLVPKLFLLFPEIR